MLDHNPIHISVTNPCDKEKLLSLTTESNDKESIREKILQSLKHAAMEIKVTL